MNIVNNPAGSYKDSNEIGLIIKGEKKDKTVFYFSKITNNPNDVNYRQISPNLFAMANAAVTISPETNLTKVNPTTQTVYYSGFKNDTTINDNWQTVYEGTVYNLWKYKP